MATVKLSVDDPEFVEKIIFEVKSAGHFDSFRKACLADVDTQPAYQNLHSRVEDSVQKFLNRQVWTPETNKNKLREEMRYNIIRAGYLESGVSRIVDQVMEQKMNSIQLKVEEILYKYVGIEKPIKKEKQPNGSLEVDTDLLPTDLEQVSPDSDKKSSLSDILNAEEIKDEEVEEEVIEDEDFESPAFEPVEPMTTEKNENSNLSAISGLTSQDSVENKSEPMQQDTQLSQISSIQDISQETPESIPPPPGEEAEIPPEPTEEPPEKSQFDLHKDSIEFTGTERKSITLDDSTNSAEVEKEKEKVLQPQDVPSNTMEIDNLYENDTTDSSEMRMEIDLKTDDTTQETVDSKVEESSQDSTVSKGKEKNKHRHQSHHKSSSKDKHKLSSSHKSTSRHHHSSSSKSRHDDKYKSRSGKSSSSSGNKKSSGDKEKSRRERDDKEKDKKSSSKQHKDDHHQEKSSSRRRRSTDHDSNEGKEKQESTPAQQQKTEDNKPVVVDSMLSENTEMSIDSKSTKKEKSSILVKYDYLKSAPKSSTHEVIEDGFCGFSDTLKTLPENPWFDCLRKEVDKNQLEAKKSEVPANSQRGKSKQKSKSPETNLTNGSEEITPEMRAQAISQQQRYTSEDLYKPRFDFGNRSRRRGQTTEESTGSEAAVNTTQ